MENWRDAGAEERELFAEEIQHAISARLEAGYDQYGPKFVGDPLMQQSDELIDAQFYNWYARRQLEQTRNHASDWAAYAKSMEASNQHYISWLTAMENVLAQEPDGARILAAISQAHKEQAAEQPGPPATPQRPCADG